jgi:hypothetical protein
MSVLDWLALVATLVTSAGLILHRHWRWGIAFLAIQYLCMFWLVLSHWPVSMAAAKLVTGWMSCTILGIARLTTKPNEDIDTSGLEVSFFHLFATGIIVAATFVLSIHLSSWLRLDLPIAWGSLLLIGMGLLHLGISAQPFRVVLGLLTILAGFEILYAAVESSILVAVLLAVVNLGLALTGAYFLNSYEKEEV